MDDVMTGRIVVGKWARLAVERQLRDMADGPARGLVFDRAAAEKPMKFFGYLKHSKGEWGGQSFALEPWQQFILWCVFGWKTRNTAGQTVRRFKRVHEEVARKNGKSTKLAGIGLYLLVADGEPGAEVYSAATKKDQARITWAEADKMVKASPDLKKIVTGFRDSLVYDASGGRFMPLASDEDTLDGLNISGAIIDELHAHKTRKVYDVIDTATGARRQPLLWAITTAGAAVEGLYADEHQYARKVLEGAVQDDSLFAIIYAIDDEDDWTDEKNWIKANPNLGVSVSLDDLRRKAQRAQEIASAQNDFIRLHLNRKTQQVTAWLQLEKWDVGKEPFDEIDLAGRPCFGGLDLSSKLDLSALVWVFPPVPEDAAWYVLARCFAPKEQALERERKDRVPYTAWERAGYLQLTDGDVIDYDFIRARLLEDSQRFSVQGVGYDPWGATQFAQQLQDAGVPVYEFRQGFGSMSEPSKELERLIVKGALRHGGNPVLRWAASHVSIQSDPAGNIKPSKSSSTERIDPIVALVMALGLAITKPVESGSIYERGERLRL